MKRSLFLVANALLAIVLLAVIAVSFDFNSLSAILARSNLLLLLAAAVFYAIAHVLAGVRYKLLLPKLTLFSLFASHMKAMLASDATPGRIGYSYFILDVRKKKVNGGLAAKALGISLASDFILRGFLALLAVFLFSQSFAQLGAIVLIASLVVMALLLHRSNLLSKILLKIPVYGKRLSEAYDFAFKSKTSLYQLGGALAVSAVGAVARGVQWLLVFNAIGLNAGLLELTVFSALLTALSFVPLSLSGFGFQEGGGILLFTLFLGIPVGQAAAAMLLVRFVDVATDAALGGWFFASKR